jgi:hypothetical protein
MKGCHTNIRIVICCEECPCRQMSAAGGEQLFRAGMFTGAITDQQLQALTPDSISVRVRTAIHAGLLRVHSKRLAKAKLQDCLQWAYDAYASELAAGGESLSNLLLAEQIPAWVFRVAVEFKWVPYPPQRQERRQKIHPDAWIPGSRTIWWEWVPLPESELVESFGGYRVQKGYRAWFTRSLESRIAHWHAEALTRSAADLGPSARAGELAPKLDEAAPVQPAFVMNGVNEKESDPPAVSWGDIEISFLSDERVQIKRAKQTETRNYGEMGFEDGRNGKPRQAWLVLRTLAESNGIIRHAAKAGEDWKRVEKRIQDIRKILRTHFGIPTDPVPFVEGIGYRARFVINCSSSFHT